MEKNEFDLMKEYAAKRTHKTITREQLAILEAYEKKNHGRVFFKYESDV